MKIKQFNSPISSIYHVLLLASWYWKTTELVHILAFETKIIYCWFMTNWQTGREIWIIRSLAPNWRSESVTSRLPPVSLSVPRTHWRRSCVDRHPESWWRLCGAGGGGPAVPRSAGRLLLPGGGCLRVSRPQLCRCLNGGWRCRVATSSSRTHRKLTLGVQTVLLFSAVSPAEVYISTLQLFGLFSSMIFPAVEAREGDRLLVCCLWRGGLA